MAERPTVSCACGCGEEFVLAPTGRPRLYATARCRNRMYHHLNREARNARSRAYARSPKGQRNHLDARMRRQWGITLVEYEALLEVQEGACAICGLPPTGQRLAVDHDHSCCPGAESCGECVRGLLCGECNLSLGKFNDNPTLLRRAVAYLEEPTIWRSSPHG